MGTAALNTEQTNKPRKKRWRWIPGVAAVCFIGWLGLVVYVDHAMRQPPDAFGGVMAKMPMPAFFLLPFA